MATSLYLNDQLADLPERGAGLTLSYSIRNLRQFGGAMGNTSYTLKLPTSSRNRRIFAHLDELTADLAFAHRYPIGAPRPDRLMRMQLFADGQLLMQGFARVLAFSDTSYEIQLLSGNADWGEQFKTRPLSDVDTAAEPGSWRHRRWLHTFDLCDYTRTLDATGWFDRNFDDDTATTAEVHAAWQTHCYPPIAYNTFSLKDNPTTPLPFEQLRPAVYVAPLLYAHFTNIGYRLESEWLDGLSRGENEHPLCLPFVRERFSERLGEDNLMVAQLSLSTDDSIANRFRNMLHFDTVDDDSAAEVGTFTYTSSASAPNGWEGGSFQTWLPQRAGRYRISGRYIADGTPGAGNVTGLSVGLLDANGVIITSFWNVIATGNTGLWDVQFDEEIEILPEWIDQGYALVMFTANSPDSGINKAGSFIQIERLNEVYEGNMYDLRANLPEVTVLELLKTLTLMFNLHFETDTERRIVRMEPRDNFYTPDGPDISPIVDRSAPLEQELLSASYPRTQRWAYANDRDDTLLDEHKQRTQRAFAAASLGNPNQTVTDTNDTEARPFSATYAQLETDSGLSVPQFIATPDEPEFRTDFAPRILYVRPRQIEEMRIENRLPDTNCPTAGYSAGVHTFERYQQAYFSGDRLSLRFDDEPGQNRGLLARYYAAEWANLAQARLVKLRARPGVPALRDLLQFRALQSFDGQRYALQRIGRVKPGAAEPFEVTLQRMDVRTRRVDFPFSQQYCLQLNGSNERVQVTDADTLLTAQYFTCSLWFRRLSGFGSLQVLASQTLASGAGFFMALNGTDHLRIGYSDGVNERGFTSVNSITDTDWHYLSFIRRSASPLDWDVLLDGENLAMSTFGAANEQSLVSLQTPIDIGGDGTNGFIGQIALVHVQHHLISQSEHSHRFNDGQGAMPYDYRRTQLLLPLNQPTGAVCPDEALPPKEATLLNKPAAGTDFGTDTWLPWRES